jgi:ubiquinone/menaquinone biosynthesis C-methylase UbiE
MSKYQFTDTDLAARRLALLASVYVPSSRKFIRNLVDRPIGCALDLGCGTGYTTVLLRDATGAGTTVGLDNSDRFIAAANSRSLKGISFFLHEVTQEPFPAGPFDIAYCRFLLSHLPDLSGCLEVWARQLNRDGLLLVEEVETIQTDVEAFEVYLEIVDQLLVHQSARLYAGPMLQGLALPATLRKASSIVQLVPVSVQDAATMFHMNIQSWRRQPYVQENYEEDEIQSLQDRLGSLASEGAVEGEITWGLRQMALRRC